MRHPYRRRRTNLIAVILALAAVFLLGIGAVIVFFSVSGTFEPTATPTATLTPTVAPTFTASITPTITDTPGPSPTPTERPVLTYTVEAGDSLFSIADKFQISVDQLVAANSLASQNIVVGQVLTIPPPSYPVPTLTPLPTGLSVNAKLFHTVKPGDTLFGIANTYQTTVDSILARNEDIITDPDNLPVGAVLEVRFGLDPWTPTLPGFTVTPAATTPAPPTASPTATKKP